MVKTGTAEKGPILKGPYIQAIQKRIPRAVDVVMRDLLLVHHAQHRMPKRHVLSSKKSQVFGPSIGISIYFVGHSDGLPVTRQL